MSLQLNAVPHVLKSDQSLYDRVSPFINAETETIYWNEIFRLGFEPRYRGAIVWAYALWTDESKPRSNCFTSALNMDSKIQAAVLDGLAMRWGLRS